MRGERKHCSGPMLTKPACPSQTEFHHHPSTSCLLLDSTMDMDIWICLHAGRLVWLASDLYIIKNQYICNHSTAFQVSLFLQFESRLWVALWHTLGGHMPRLSCKYMSVFSLCCLEAPCGLKFWAGGPADN